MKNWLHRWFFPWKYQKALVVARVIVNVRAI